MYAIRSYYDNQIYIDAFSVPILHNLINEGRKLACKLQIPGSYMKGKSFTLKSHATTAPMLIPRKADLILFKALFNFHHVQNAQNSYHQISPPLSHSSNLILHFAPGHACPLPPRSNLFQQNHTSNSSPASQTIRVPHCHRIPLFSISYTPLFIDHANVNRISSRFSSRLRLC